MTKQPKWSDLDLGTQKAYLGDFSATEGYSQKCVRLFISSTFTDTKLERNYLMKHTYPILRDYFRARRLEFVVVDMRWGIRDEATDDHMTTAICMSEIDKCIQNSVETFFVFLSGDKYGWRPLPAVVEAEEFEIICQHISDPADLSFVNEWYMRDDNLVVPEYLLQTISSKIPDYKDPDKKIRDAAGGIWWNTQERLLTILRDAVAICKQNNLIQPSELEKWSVSVTHQEVIRGGLAHPSRSVCFMRTITDLVNQPYSKLLEQYINCDPSGIDITAYDLLKQLREEVKKTFVNNVWKYTIPWTNQGIHDGEPEHQKYVKKLAEDFERIIIDKIESYIKVEPLSHPHTTEVLAHGHICNSRAKIFRGREDIISHIKKFVFPAIPQSNEDEVDHSNDKGDSDGDEEDENSDGDDNLYVDVEDRNAFKNYVDEIQRCYDRSEYLCKKFDLEFNDVFETAQDKGLEEGQEEEEQEEENEEQKQTKETAKARKYNTVKAYEDILLYEATKIGQGYTVVRIKLTFDKSTAIEELNKMQARMEEIHKIIVDQMVERREARAVMTERRKKIEKARKDDNRKKKAQKSALDQKFGQIMVVYGQSGFGKTSVMAKAVTEVKKLVSQQQQDSKDLKDPKDSNNLNNSKNSIVIARFCGTTPYSTSSFRLVLSICQQLKIIFQDSEAAKFLGEIPSSDYKPLIRAFPAWLALASASRPIILFIDSLDQIIEEFSKELNWLPIEIPPHVYIIVSSIGDSTGCFQELLRRRADGKILPQNFIEVGELKTDEIQPIVDSWLASDGRTLQPSQRAELNSAASSNPNALFLRLLYDRASKWKSFSKPEKLEDTVGGLINAFFDRLEKYNGKQLVRHVFGLLAASKYGLSEEEVIDIISGQDSVLATIFQFHNPPQARVPPLLIIRLKNDCGEYMTDRGAHGTTVFGWYHRQFWEAANDRYFQNADKEYYSNILKDYFMGDLAKRFPDRGIANHPTWFGTGDSKVLNMRKLIQLPHALLGAKQMTSMVEVLADLDWVEANSFAGLVHELIFDYHQSITLATQSNLVAPELAKLTDFVQFVKESADTLQRYPHLTLQLAINKPSTYLVSMKASDILQHSKLPYVEWVNKPSFIANSELTMKGHHDVVRYCCFAGKDHSSLVTCSDDKTVRVWSVLTGQHKLCFRGHEFIPTLCDAYENRVSSADKNVMYIWNLETGTIIAKCNLLQGPYSMNVTLCNFSSDGKRLITAGRTHFWQGNPVGAVIIWNGETGKRLGIPLAYSLDRTVFDFSDDCTKVLVLHITENSDTFPPLGRGDRKELWDITIPKEQEEEENEEQSFFQRDKQVYLRTPRYTRMAHYFIDEAGSSRIPFGCLSKAHETCLNSWPRSENVYFKGNEVYVQEDKSPEGYFSFGIKYEQYSPSFKKVVGMSKAIAYVYDYVSSSYPNMYRCRLSGHSDTVQHAVFSPDENLVATVSSDHTAKIWRISNNNPTQNNMEGTMDLKARTQGKFINGDKVVVKRDNVLETHSLLGGYSQIQAKHIRDILTYAVSYDGKLAVTVGSDETLCLWDLESGAELQVQLITWQIISITFSPNSRHVIAASSNNMALVWEMSANNDKLEIVRTFPLLDVIVILVFSPDGKYIALGSVTGQLYIAHHNPKNSEPIEIISTYTNINSQKQQIGIGLAEFSSNGNLLGFGDELGNVLVYDIATSRLIYSDRCFVNRADSITFAKSDQYTFVGSSEEKRIRVIDIPNSMVLIDYILTIPFLLTTVAVNAIGQVVTFDSKGTRYHLQLHHKKTKHPKSIQPLDSHIKQKWHPKYISGNWFQVGEDWLTEFNEGKDFDIVFFNGQDFLTTRYWRAQRDLEDKTKNSLAWYHHTPCQGALFALGSFLPIAEYEVVFWVKVTMGRIVDILMSADGKYANGCTLNWKAADQKKNRRGYVGVHVGKIVVVQPCEVFFKMNSEWLHDGTMSGGYWLESIQLRVVERDGSEVTNPFRQPSNIGLNVGDEVKVAHTDAQIQGKVIRWHGEKLEFKILATVNRYNKGAKMIKDTKDILIHTKQAENPLGFSKSFLPVIVQVKPGVWNSAELYGMTDTSYVMKVQGTDDTLFPLDAKLIEDFDVSHLNIKLNDIVLCKKEEEWVVSVVVVVSEQDQFCCVHTCKGDELAVSVQNVRILNEDDENRVRMSIATKLLFFDGLNEALLSPNSLRHKKEQDTIQNTPGHIGGKIFSETIDSLFLQADADQSGDLSFEEVKTLAANVGLIMTQKAWGEVLKKMDKDGNDLISKEELTIFWRDWLEDSGFGLSPTVARKTETEIIVEVKEEPKVDVTCLAEEQGPTEAAQKILQIEAKEKKERESIAQVIKRRIRKLLRINKKA